MDDRYRRMRTQRQRAIDALAAINVQLDILKDAMGAFGAEIDSAQAAPKQERPNREASKYAGFVDMLSEDAEEGWVSLDEVLAAIAKAVATPPTRGNLKRALNSAASRGFLEAEGERYRSVSDI